MLKPVYLVAFSGHRPADSPGRTNSDLIGAAPHIEKALAKLKSQAETNGSELQFISSLAAGSDIIACRAALRLGLPLHIILPLPEEEFFNKGFLEKDHLAAWKAPALRVLAAVHPHSKLAPALAPTHPEILPITHSDGSRLDLNPSDSHTFRILDSTDPDDERFAMANALRLVNADTLIAVYDGSPSNGLGSTADLITLAEARAIPVVWINPADLSITRLRCTSDVSQPRSTT